MITVTANEIPLDDKAIKELVKSLGLKTISLPFPHRHLLPELGADEPLPYWTDYFWLTRITSHWHKKNAVWFQPKPERKSLIILTLSGFRNKTEANGVLTRLADAPPYDKSSPEAVARFANRILNPSGFERQDAFELALRNIREMFAWDGESIINGPGDCGQISTYSLLDEDIDLLREVYRRLRPIGGVIKFDPPKPQAPRRKIDDLKHARKKVAEYSRSYADEGFDLWVSRCLQSNSQGWTRSAILYAHYEEWVRKGGHGENRPEKAEVKATVLSAKVWGSMMVRQYQRRRDGRGNHYQVTIKRGRA